MSFSVYKHFASLSGDFSSDDERVFSFIKNPGEYHITTEKTTSGDDVCVKTGCCASRYNYQVYDLKKQSLVFEVNDYTYPQFTFPIVDEHQYMITITAMKNKSDSKALDVVEVYKPLHVSKPTTDDESSNVIWEYRFMFQSDVVGSIVKTDYDRNGQLKTNVFSNKDIQNASETITNHDNKSSSFADLKAKFEKVEIETDKYENERYPRAPQQVFEAGDKDNDVITNLLTEKYEIDKASSRDLHDYNQDVYIQEHPDFPHLPSGTMTLDKAIRVKNQMNMNKF